MVLGRDYDVDQALVFLVGPVDVDVAEVSDMRLHHAFSDLYVNDGFFVSQRQDRVPVFLILVSEI
jgi:hypothetical protein